ncbi:hypothetical protein IC229_33175 [Spirosoma sp. BT702]|uniref:Uncharacterized protein n=1 Tax=Spirosoma profusum TaxID=2771354 RepID=A0A927AW76_9BACT|nr:hypothetical protein [Spirosoma profusum]MBD2705511.1 hypothetical protein [Spirosoma profusum]
MQTLNHNDHTLRYYYYLDEFPAERRSYFTRYLIEASELDSTPEALSERIGSIMQLNAESRTQDVQVALQNLLFSLSAIRIGYAPDELAFGAILHDVDGVAVTDFSPDGLKNLLQPLQLPSGTIAGIIEEVKKNFRRSGNAISPVLLGIYN